MKWSFHFWRSAVGVALVGASLLLARCNLPDLSHGSVCVPRIASVYRYDIGAWVDVEGNVLLYAPSVSSFGWCGS